ncbi:MAG TPA: AAA family ATPase [Polyangiaceae bacterium]|nr:AAA family ATPase [Polyangiaceae bacterium]
MSEYAREFRIFVSSTFEDLSKERKALTDVFAKLKRQCAVRGIAFLPIDLRWGLTDKRKLDEGPLQLCFNEIDRCRPHFLGIIGERCGSRPERIPIELLERAPWLRGAQGLSNTELEFEYGPLRDPETSKKALIFFKQAESIQQDEGVSPQEIERFAAFKARVRSASIGRGLLPFNGPWDLAHAVERHLRELIDEEIPNEAALDYRTLEALDHAAFAATHDAFAGRARELQALKEFSKSDDRVLVLEGPAGIGKSALLTAFMNELEAEAAHPRSPIAVVHYVGARNIATEPDAVLRRLILELAHKLGAKPSEPPRESHLVREVFHDLLRVAGSSGRRVAIILDGFDRLDSEDEAEPLLPDPLPNGVQVIVSVARRSDLLPRIGVRTLTLGALQIEDRRQVIEVALERVGKQLAPEACESIARHQPCAVPRYLHALLDELGRCDQHHRLEQETTRLLATDIDAPRSHPEPNPDMFADLGRNSPFWRALGVIPGTTSAPLPDEEILEHCIEGLHAIMQSIVRRSSRTLQRSTSGNDADVVDAHPEMRRLADAMDAVKWASAGLMLVKAGGDPVWRELQHRLPTFWANLQARDW